MDNDNQENCVFCGMDLKNMPSRRAAKSGKRRAGPADRRKAHYERRQPDKWVKGDRK